MTYSPLFGSNYSLLHPKPVNRRTIARLFNSRIQKKDRELLRELLGEAPGETATVSYARIQHDLGELGGKRVVENVNLIDRVTTTEDVADLKDNLLSFSTTEEAYTPDISKNP